MENTPTLSIKDTRGVPMNMGNRNERRFIAKQMKASGIDQNAHEQFEKEPVWMAMEKVMNKMKEFYMLNKFWIFSDEHAMAILEDMRIAHEEREEKIRVTVVEARETEHRNIDTLFARIEDKKILKNQLFGMKEEHSMLLKLAKLQTENRK